MNWKLTLFLLAVVAWYFIMKWVDEADKKKKERIEADLEEFTQSELRTVYWYKDFNPNQDHLNSRLRQERIKVYRKHLNWPQDNWDMPGGFHWRYKEGTMEQVPECYDMYSDELYMHNRARLKHMWIKDLYKVNSLYGQSWKTQRRNAVLEMVTSDTNQGRKAWAMEMLSWSETSNDWRRDEVLSIYKKAGIKPAEINGRYSLWYANLMEKHDHCLMCTKEKRDWARANNKCDNPYYEEPKIEW